MVPRPLRKILQGHKAEERCIQFSEDVYTFQREGKVCTSNKFSKVKKKKKKKGKEKKREGGVSSLIFNSDD